MESTAATESASVEDAPFAQGFARMCLDGFEQGWHEANGGNLSYRLSDQDVALCMHQFSYDRPWTPMSVEDADLAGAFFMVTGAGKYMRNVPSQMADATGIIQINDAGNAWRIVWGLENGGRPSSEFPTHYLNHAIRMRATDGRDRVIYHTHCPNIIALSTLIEPDSRTWTRILWKSMTECVFVFPDGVGVVPWMIPGGADIAKATCKLMETYDAVIWTQHGMFVAGQDFDAAFGLMHMIEKSAGLYLAERAANGGAEPPFQISDDQLRAVCVAKGCTPNPAFLD